MKNKEIITTENKEIITNDFSKFQTEYVQGEGAISNIDNRFIQLGQLCIAQPLSPIFMEGLCKIGDLHDRESNEVLATNGTGLEIIIVDYKLNYAYYDISTNAKTSKKKIWLRNEVISPISPKKFVKNFEENGIEIETAIHHQFTIIVVGKDIPYKLVMKGASIPTASKILTEMKVLDAKRVPFYAQVFKLFVVDKQTTDFGKVKAFGVEKARVVTDDEFVIAKSAVKAIAQNKYNMELDNQINDDIVPF